MYLDVSVNLSSAPPNGVVGIRLAVGYKHFTPPGWKGGSMSGKELPLGAYPGTRPNLKHPLVNFAICFIKVS